MNSTFFLESFEKSLNKNFDAFKNYFDFEFHVFPELGSTVYEINKCLILDFNRASITLTNNLLERVLKLALIYNETGIGPIPTEKWSDTFAGPVSKYSSIKLGNSIEKCKKENLISSEEKDILFNSVRTLFRNGYSHADSNEILKDYPESGTFFKGNLKSGTAEKVELNQKDIPVFQTLMMDEFAKSNAKGYFILVFNLMKNIDNRLKKNK